LNGLRISEALNADIDDLSTERGHRTSAIARQGGKHVTIPIAPRTGRALDLYIDERTMGPIFLGVQGGCMDRHCADRMVKRLVEHAGIDKRTSPHSLRHSFITAALDAGVPPRDVQEAASHADPRTTMRYDRARGNLDRHATYIVSTFIPPVGCPLARRCGVGIQGSCDTFVSETLVPALPTISGGLAGPPQERAAEVTNLLTA
jgi:integrase/recombinase XerD